MNRWENKLDAEWASDVTQADECRDGRIPIYQFGRSGPVAWLNPNPTEHPAPEPEIAACSMDWEPDAVFNVFTTARAASPWSWKCACGEPRSLGRDQYPTAEAARGAFLSHKHGIAPLPVAHPKRPAALPNGPQAFCSVYLAAGFVLLCVLPAPMNIGFALPAFLAFVIGFIRYA